MKNLTTALLGICMIGLPYCMDAQIQRQGFRAAFISEARHGQFVTPKRIFSVSEAQKLSGIGSRLIAQYNGSGDPAGAYQDMDSTTYQYSNGTTDLADVQTVYLSNGIVYSKYNKLILSYDRNGLITEVIEQIWRGTVWENDYKYVYTYNIDGQLINLLSQTWKSGNWENFYRGIITYVGPDRPVTITLEIWDDLSNTWVNSYRNTYSYDAADNNISSQSEIWDAAGGVWLRQLRLLFYYNSQNALISSVFQIADSSGISWENVDSVSNVSMQAGGLPLITLSYSWTSLDWMLYGRDTYTYTLADLESTSLREYWDGNTYTDDQRRISSYNNYDQLTKRYTESSDGAGGWQVWIYDYMERYHYEPYTTTGIGTARAQESLLLYPNPADELVHLAFRDMFQSETSIQVFSATGCLVKKARFPVAATVDLDIRDLPSGHYFLQLSRGENQQYMPLTKY